MMKVDDFMFWASLLELPNILLRDLINTITEHRLCSPGNLCKLTFRLLCEIIF